MHNTPELRLVKGHTPQKTAITNNRQAQLKALLEDAFAGCTPKFPDHEALAFMHNLDRKLDALLAHLEVSHD